MKEKIYQVAIDTHKFYDEVSMKIVVGIISITGAAFFIKDKISLHASSVLFVVALIIMALLFMYRNCAYYANVARNVAAYNETNEDLIGVSHVLVNKEKYKELQLHKGKKIRINIYGTVHFIWFVCFLGLLFSACTSS